jgi:hypothetical protein
MPEASSAVALDGALALNGPLAITPAAANNPTFGFAGTPPGVTETVIDSVLLSTRPKRFLHLSVDIVSPTP